MMVSEVEPRSMGIYEIFRIFLLLCACFQLHGSLRWAWWTPNYLSWWPVGTPLSSMGPRVTAFVFSYTLLGQSLASMGRLFELLFCLLFASGTRRSQFISAGFDVRLWFLWLHDYPLRSVWLS